MPNHASRRNRSDRLAAHDDRELDHQRAAERPENGFIGPVPGVDPHSSKSTAWAMCEVIGLATSWLSSALASSRPIATLPSPLRDLVIQLVGRSLGDGLGLAAGEPLTSSRRRSRAIYKSTCGRTQLAASGAVANRTLNARHQTTALLNWPMSAPAGTS